MNIEKSSSAVYNNIVSGLGGIDVNQRFTIEQIEDSLVNEFMGIVKEYFLKGIVPKKDLMLSIKCLEIDCQNLSKCCGKDFGISTQHVQIPQIFNAYQKDAIGYFGSVDFQIDFTVYTDRAWQNHKYKRRSKNKPYVWIDTTPNENGFYDCFIFGAPLLKTVTVQAIFKDVRQLKNYNLSDEELDNFSYITKDVESRVTEKFVRYYRELAAVNSPNDQQIK
jgi:hypothetical protein